MIRKVYEVDPLLCPQCGTEMKVISFIEGHEVIDRIIRHLKLTFFVDCPTIYADLSILFGVKHVVLDVIYSLQVVRG